MTLIEPWDVDGLELLETRLTFFLWCATLTTVTLVSEGYVAYGIDLSHHQSPNSLPWKQFEGAVDFVFCRATYGAELRDRHATEHVRRSRAIGAKVGLYHFYRPIHSVAAQWDAFRAVADTIDLGVGDLVPALDIELDPFPKPGTKVEPSWSKPCEELAAKMADNYGDVLVYITQREWGELGKPQWVLERPLWVAHYTNASAPATPGDRQPTIWQHRVAPFMLNGPGGYDKARPELDQNRGLKPIPTIAQHPDEGFDMLRDKGVLECFDYTQL